LGHGGVELADTRCSQSCRGRRARAMRWMMRPAEQRLINMCCHFFILIKLVRIWIGENVDW